MKRKVDIEKLVSPVYEQLFFEYFKTRTKILYGGRNSAKSWVCAFFVIVIIIQPEYSKWICVRKVYQGIKKSMFDTLKAAIELMGLTDEFKFNQAQGNLAITHLPTGNKIFFMGLDNPANAKSIANPTAVWFEEADEITLTDYIKTKQSIRGPKGTIFHELLSFNPSYESSWVNDYFFPAKESYEVDNGLFDVVPSIKEDVFILHTCYKHNYWCTPEQKKDLEGNRLLKDENYYRVDTLGLWGGALKGLVYKNWDIYSGDDPEGQVIYGLDFGFNDPTALIKVTRIENNIYLRELYYESEKYTQEFIQAIKNDGLIHSTNANIYADSSRPDSIEEIYKEKYNIHGAEKGKGSIFSGINYVKSFNLFVHQDSINLISELKAYKWKQDRAGKLREEPVDSDNHLLDAMRYAIMDHGPKYWTKKPRAKISKRRDKINRANKYENY